MSYVLEVSPRSEVGKSASRLLRREKSLVPGVVYGGDQPSQPVSIGQALLDKALKSDGFIGHIVEIKLGDDRQKVLVKAIDRHPFLPKVLSIDFQRVTADRKIKMRVPIRIKGSENCKDLKLGAVLAMSVDFALICCLPKNLPAYLEADISELTVGSSLYLSDIKPPEGVGIFNLLHGNVSYNHCVLQLIKPRKTVDKTMTDDEQDQAAEASEDDSK